MPSLRAGYLAGLLLLSASLTRGVEAQVPEGVTLDWKTSSECTSPLDLEWQVARLLDPDVVVDEPLAFHASVDALPAGRYALALMLTRGAQRLNRHVELASCAEVRDAVALLVAITIDPKAAVRAREEAPEKPTPEPLRSAPAAPPPAPKPSPPAPSAERAWRTGLTVGALGDLQTLPGATAGPMIGVELGLGRLRTWIDGHYFAPRYAKSDVDGVEARIELAAGTLGVAYVANFGAIGLGPRLAAELGYLRAVGIGLDDRRTTGTFWVAALIGGRFDYDVHARVSLRAGLDIGVPLRRPKLALDPAPIFYRTSAVTGRIELSVLFRLGSRP